MNNSHEIVPSIFIFWSITHTCLSLTTLITSSLVDISDCTKCLSCNHFVSHCRVFFKEKRKKNSRNIFFFRFSIKVNTFLVNNEEKTYIWWWMLSTCLTTAWCVTQYIYYLIISPLKFIQVISYLAKWENSL